MAKRRRACDRAKVSRSLRFARSCAPLGLSLSLLLTLACAPAHQAYIEWRPGLSAIDFDGTFELSLDEFTRFDDEAEGYARFDRRRGTSSADAAELMAALGQRVAATPVVDARGYALVSLEGDGGVVLRGSGDQNYSGQVDWFALSPDARHAAFTSGSKLAVVVDGASAGVELGSLLGGRLDGHHLMMNVGEGELTVFALPEIGGAVTAYETGFLVSFRHQPGARERWDITVARVSITM